MEVALTDTKLMLFISSKFFGSSVSTTNVPRDVSVLYVQKFIHEIAKGYLLLHKPDYYDFQSYMARSTSDGARLNVDYRRSKLIPTNITGQKLTHKYITRILELAADEVVHVEVADDVQQVPQAMLVQVLCADVSRVDVGRNEVDEDPSLRHELSDEEELQRDVLRPRAEGSVSQREQRRCVFAVQRHFRDVLAKP